MALAEFDPPVELASFLPADSPAVAVFIRSEEDDAAAKLPLLLPVFKLIDCFG